MLNLVFRLLKLCDGFVAAALFWSAHVFIGDALHAAYRGEITLAHSKVSEALSPVAFSLTILLLVALGLGALHILLRLWSINRKSPIGMPH